MFDHFRKRGFLPNAKHLPKHRREKPGQPGEKHSRVSIANITAALPKVGSRSWMVAKVARSFLTLILLALVSGSHPSTGEFSPSLQSDSRQLSSSVSSPQFYGVAFISSEAPCTLGDSYQNQPTAQCQSTYDTHRLTVFIIAALSIQTLLLGAILAMQFRHH